MKHFIYCLLFLHLHFVLMKYLDSSSYALLNLVTDWETWGRKARAFHHYRLDDRLSWLFLFHLDSSVIYRSFKNYSYFFRLNLHWIQLCNKLFLITDGCMIHRYSTRHKLGLVVVSRNFMVQSVRKLPKRHEKRDWWVSRGFQSSFCYVLDGADVDGGQ